MSKKQKVSAPEKESFPANDQNEVVEAVVEKVEEKQEVPVKVKGPKKFKINVPHAFDIHINGESFAGICEVTPDQHEVIQEIIGKRQAAELAGLEGRIKTIVRSAQGALVVQDGGSVLKPK